MYIAFPQLQLDTSADLYKSNDPLVIWTPPGIRQKVRQY